MKPYTFYFLLLIIFFSCKNNEGEINSIISKDREIVSGELPRGYKTYLSDSVSVNIPSNWKPTKIKDALFYVPLNVKEQDMYYVVLKYDISKINIKSYLKEIFKQLSEKNSTFNYSLKKYNFKNTGSCYYLEIYTNENNIKYKVYSIIYESGSKIYDFSFKTLDLKNKNVKNYRVFYNILFSFKLNQSNIIDAEKFIIDNEEVLEYKDL